MKEIFTEEEYNEAVKKFNEEMKIDFFDKIENYPTYQGYEDLKTFEIPESDFKILWRLQELLYIYDMEKSSLALSSCTIYEQIKKLYSNFFMEK